MSWTPTDEQVEKAARALAEEFGWRDFGTLDPQALDTAKVGVRAVLVAVGPTIAASAWQEGWGSGYVDRHRERVGDDGHVVRNDPTPNPYIEKEAGR